MRRLIIRYLDRLDVLLGFITNTNGLHVSKCLQEDLGCFMWVDRCIWANWCSHCPALLSIRCVCIIKHHTANSCTTVCALKIKVESQTNVLILRFYGSRIKNTVGSDIIIVWHFVFKKLCARTSTMLKFYLHHLTQDIEWFLMSGFVNITFLMWELKIILWVVSNVFSKSCIC